MMSRQETRQTLAPVGKRLREAQTQAGLKNEELAQRLGVSVRLLQKWRAGTVTPRYANVLRLGDELDKPASFFYGEEAA